MSKLTTRNILKLYRQATPEQRQAGHDWYNDAHTIASALAFKYGHTLEQTAGVIAALSPLRSWGDNVNIASRAISQGYLHSGAFKDSLYKVNRILSGEHPDSALGGDKVKAFYAGIVSAGHTDSVCVDRHAYDAATNTRHNDDTRPRLTSKRYRLIADLYVRASRQISRESGLRVSAAQVQAVVWLVWRARFWQAGAYDSFNAI